RIGRPPACTPDALRRRGPHALTTPGITFPMRKLLLLATLGACAGAADREPEIVVRRDSLGIELVESRAPLLSDAQLSAALVAEPALAIGAADGEAQYMLHRVVGASRFEDGSIVVVNGGTAELRFYDSTGRHLHSRGGKGGGP